MYRQYKAHRTCLILALAAALAAPTVSASNSSAGTGRRRVELSRQVELVSKPAAPGASAVTETVVLPSSTNVRLFGPFAEARRSTALIVLTAEAGQQEIGALTEDLNIMCRIFDRALGDAGLKANAGGRLPFLEYLGSNERGSWLTSLLDEGSSRTESLYVEGYGPLFLIGVDFPLQPPPETPEATEPNGTADPLWDQVAREMAGQPAPAAPGSTAAERQYSPEKVASLKSTLARTLKHAANIRDLGEDTHVTVVVESGQTQRLDDAGRSLPRMMMYGEPMRMYGEMYGASLSQVPPQASVLAVRATMNDIEAFAAGSLSFADFEKRVESTQY
jgi:hypothetical protein